MFISLLVILRQICIFPSFDKIDASFEIVIFVKNAQNQIEGIIKDYYQLETKPDELWIVDCGSNDQTPQILERISRQFPGLRLLFFQNMSSKTCMQQTLPYLDESAILFLDGTKLKSKDIHKLIRYLCCKKNVKIGLKTYEK